MPKLTDWLMQPRPEPDPAPRRKPIKNAWYKVHGMAVHMHGGNLPAPCVHCRGISSLLCDYPLSDGGTCAAPLCAECAKEIAPDRHLCPLHVKVAAQRKGSLL